MNNQFSIQPYSLKDIHFSLNVPAYQRPYCWTKDEIEKLLNDFKDHIQEDIYYIGNVITLKNGENYDLIDGQQRMTTLWILSLYLSKFNSTIIQFCKSKEKSRLNFAIRKQTNNYLEDLLKQNIEDEFWKINRHIINEESSNTDPSIYQNNNILQAFKVIHEWFNEHFTVNQGEKKEFAQFVFDKVRFQFLIAPSNTDENKLFIQINTNGTQFQHVDILKAELINAIHDNEEKTKYAELWDKLILKYYTKNYNRKVEYKDNPLLESNLFDLVDKANEEIYLNQDLSEEKVTDYRFEYIIDINTLLLHCLFIYCKKYNLEPPEIFNAEKLLEIFKAFRVSISNEAHNRNEIAINFLNLLQSIKEIINNHFIFKDIVETTFVFIPEEYKIKDNEDEDDETNNPLSTNRLILAQLQRMLYHSNNDNKHYWLGIYLNEYINTTNQLVDLHLLEKVDNNISLKGKSFDTYRDYFRDEVTLAEDINEEIPFETFLYKKFSRYWFYKLEYILWKETKEIDKHIISRTSVEHILTQKERASYKKQDIEIDEFGNLVLISVSENSTFSDKNILNKYDYFKGLTNPPYKMKELYTLLNEKSLVKDILTDDEQLILKSVLEEHKNEMIDKIKSHYKA